MNMLYLTPIVSSFIGYFTNHIAIIMLFRPYKDIKLGKFKIFGKGVIPSNHIKLANSVGQTVSNELLSHEDVLKELHSGEVRDFAKDFVHGKLESLFQKELASPEEILPENLSAVWLEISKNIENKIEFKIEEFLNNENNLKSIAAFLENWLKNLNPDTIISDKQKDSIKISLKEQIFKLISSNLTEDNISLFINKLLKNLEEDDRLLQDIIPDSLDQRFQAEFGKVSDFIIDEFLNFLEKNEDNVKVKIKDKILETINNMNLGMLTAFISEDFLADKVKFIPEKVLSFSREYLKSEEGKKKIISAINNLYHKFKKKKIQIIIKEIELTANHEFVEGIAGFVINSLTTKQMTEMISSNIGEFINDNLDSMLTDTFDYVKNNSEELALNLINNLSRFIIDNPKIWKEIYHTEFNNLIKSPIGKISNFVQPKEQTKIQNFIWKRVSEFIIKYAPEMIKTINIKEMVTEKVKSFSLPKLEKIIREVAAKELRYVTIFGGILGFLIGTIQLLFFILT